MEEKGFRNLAVWQKAIKLCGAIYEISRKLPGDERYGLISQMCRAATAIPANIAEGYGRGSKGDYARFIDIAFGSSCELETYLAVCIELGYLEEKECEALIAQIAEINKMLRGLKKSLRRED